jgi:hypothetical protein
MECGVLWWVPVSDSVKLYYFPVRQQAGELCRLPKSLHVLLQHCRTYTINYKLWNSGINNVFCMKKIKSFPVLRERGFYTVCRAPHNTY